jgi:hypothetical protein
MAQSSPAAAKDIWHFARPELARQYLKEFDVGLIAARVLFAPRRMGKSQFLEKDLIPAAREHGMVTAYLNLWQSRSAPTQALLGALSQTLEPKGFTRFLKRLKSVKSMKLSAGIKAIADGKLELEWASLDLASATTLLWDALKELPAKKRLLLVLDEAQVLAMKEHTELAHSLRANLDSRKNSIKVVFAGSSEVTLRQMFGRVNEPFYNWAPLEPFALLGYEFVDHLTRLVNGLSKYPLSQEHARAAFDALKQTPEFFRRFLNQYLTHAMEGHAAALAETFSHVYHAEEFERRWRELLPRQRNLLRLLAEECDDIFSEGTRRRLGKDEGGAPIAVTSVQKALGRLEALGHVARLDRGIYRFQDEIFLEWVTNRALQGSSTP